MPEAGGVHHIGYWTGDLAAEAQAARRARLPPLRHGRHRAAAEPGTVAPSSSSCATCTATGRRCATCSRPDPSSPASRCPAPPCGAGQGRTAPQPSGRTPCASPSSAPGTSAPRAPAHPPRASGRDRQLPRTPDTGRRRRPDRRDPGPHHRRHPQRRCRDRRHPGEEHPRASRRPAQRPARGYGRHRHRQLRPRAPGRAHRRHRRRAAQQWVQAQLRRPVVKAFNTIGPAGLASLGAPAGTVSRTTIPIVEATTGRQVRRAGTRRPAGLRRPGHRRSPRSWRQQPGTPVHTTGLPLDAARRAWPTRPRTRPPAGATAPTTHKAGHHQPPKQPRKACASS